MSETTVTRADLAEAVYQEVGLSRNDSATLVETVLGEIVDALTQGQTVKISSFGSFSVRQKGQRVGRNPKTGEEVPILPRRVLVFRASHVLKNRINRSMTKAQTAAAAPSAAPAATATAPAAQKAPIALKAPAAKV
jgi:integration host factor subunit alpha